MDFSLEMKSPLLLPDNARNIYLSGQLDHINRNKNKRFLDKQEEKKFEDEILERDRIDFTKMKEELTKKKQLHKEYYMNHLKLNEVKKSQERENLLKEKENEKNNCALILKPDLRFFNYKDKFISRIEKDNLATPRVNKSNYPEKEYVSIIGAVRDNVVLNTEEERILEYAKKKKNYIDCSKLDIPSKSTDVKKKMSHGYNILNGQSEAKENLKGNTPAAFSISSLTPIRNKESLQSQDNLPAYNSVKTPTIINYHQTPNGYLSRNALINQEERLNKQQSNAFDNNKSIEQLRRENGEENYLKLAGEINNKNYKRVSEEFRRNSGEVHRKQNNYRQLLDSQIRERYKLIDFLKKEDLIYNGYAQHQHNSQKETSFYLGNSVSRNENPNKIDQDRNERNPYSNVLSKSLKINGINKNNKSGLWRIGNNFMNF